MPPVDEAPTSPSGPATPGTESPSPLLERLAARVRSRRKELALTLRELAAAAEVSERFLGLLEGGGANVSVTRLDDIARALGTSAAALLEESAPVALVRRPHARAAARAPAPLVAPRAGGALVALLGVRGAGKTTLGERAARRLGMPFFELDGLVAARAGTSLGHLFELHGGAYYRKLEHEELERLVATRAQGIVATGGSLVTEHATFELLRRAAVTIWLRARPEDHWSRVVAQGDARPMANRSSAMGELRALLRARRALYEQADHVVDTSALGLERATERVVRLTRDAWCRRTDSPP